MTKVQGSAPRPRAVSMLSGCSCSARSMMVLPPARGPSLPDRVPAEGSAHRCRHFLGEGLPLPSPEPGKERRRECRHRNVLLDRVEDGPAALAVVLDIARQALQLRVLLEGPRRQFQEP